MNKQSWVAMTGLCVWLAASAAQAHLVTLDAGTYASGTEVSNAFDGVALSHVTFTEAGRQSSAVYASPCSGVRECDGLEASSFGWQKANGKALTYWYASADVISNCLQQNHSGCYAQPQHLLEVSLDEATDFIRFDSINATDSPWAWAFDAAGNLLSLTPVRSTDGLQSLTLTSAAGNIRRILIGGNDGYSIVNRISYNTSTTPAVTSVPAPATLALMGIGLIGLAIATRTRRRASNDS